MLLSHVSRSAEQVQICHKYHDPVRFKYILLCHNNDFNNFMAPLLWNLSDKVPKAELLRKHISGTTDGSLRI